MRRAELGCGEEAPIRPVPNALLFVGLIGCKPPVEPPITSTTETAHTGQTTPAVSCENPPTRPLEQRDVPGRANEDITFDAQGFLVGADRGDTLWRTDSDGNQTLVIPNSGVNAGLRLMWWDGTLASAQYATGAIYRIDPNTASSELMVGGLGLPSGIEVGIDRAIWFGELANDRVQRYHPETDTLTVIAEGLLRPNGLTFNPTYDRLYVAATGENRIYAIDIDPDTSAVIGEPWVAVEGVGTGVDGLSFDECGNLYAGYWDRAKISRIDLDTGEEITLVEKPNQSFALGNWAWGKGAFGWDPHKIYVVKYGPAEVIEIDLGVGEKPRPTP